MIETQDFRNRLRAREQSAPEPTCEKTFGGLPFVMRRAPIETMVAAGVLPESFYREMVAAQTAARDGQAHPERTVHEFLDTADAPTLASIALAGPRLILAAVVEPRLVAGVAGAGEISLLELPTEIQNEIVAWVMAGSPDVPVRIATRAGEQKEQEVRRDSLVNFRPKQPGGKPFSLDPDGEGPASVAV